MIITLIVILSIIVILLYRNKLLLSPNFYRYIYNVHPKMFKVKTNTIFNLSYSNRILFLFSYLMNIRKPITKESLILKKKMTKVYLMMGKKTYVKFLISKHLEMTMPYTIGNYIVIDENKIESISTETLLHETFHIIQRNNQTKFNAFYKSYYPFLHDRFPLEKLPNKLKEKYMTNPDSNFDIWTYKINGKIYIPILEYKKGGLIENLYLQSNIDASPIKINQVLHYGKHVSLYHPNEIFACETAHQIMNNKLHYKIKELLKKI